MTATTIFDVVILKGPSQYYTWYAAIKGLVAKDLKRYFDPKKNDVYVELEPVTFNTIKPGATSLYQLNNIEKQTFTELRSIYISETQQYQRFLTEEAKLRNKIMLTANKLKKSMLYEENTIREWLLNL